ncbi:protein SpAN-like isoform X2 [Acanthaster planci]|uniref:Protein SpAN-like isoform X2 n=1 Tax=Acanthaster planci TaxID=133434 RepID=A0A8B7XYN4_ACAPL|nr:protein SpAN-like isoform X2 [Acanthaster planci]
MKFAAVVTLFVAVSQLVVGHHFDLKKFKEEFLENAKTASEMQRHPEVKENAEGAVHAETKRAALDCTEPGTCGGNFQDSGCIVSPNFGQGGYDNGLNCAYNIKAPEGKRVELTILDMDIEYHAQCNWDRMEIFLGQGIFGALKICGSDLPAGTFLSLADTMTVRFKSDASVNGRGFAAKFESVTTE